MDLSKRREEILAEHRAQEKYDPYWRAEAERGLRLSERPVALLVDDEVVVLGDCVARVLAGLARFAEAMAPVMADPEAVVGVENYRRHAFARAQKLLAGPPPAELRLHQQAWNAVLCGLNEAGVLVVTADGTHGG